jgi:DeoR/GlpR family transcriptional regulator of sugar metabolism
VADSSKFEKKLFAWLCPVEKLDVVVTDSIDENLKKKFEEKNVDVVIA